MSKRYNYNLYQNYQRNLIKATVSTNVGINSYDRVIREYGTGATRAQIMLRIKKYSKFTIWWYSIFFILGITCLLLDPSGWFNVLDLFIVMVNIDLVARGKLSGMYIGVLECFLYAYICFSSQLFGEVIKVLAISVPLNIVSIINWTKENRRKKKELVAKKDDEIVVKRIKKKEMAVIIIITAVIFTLCYLLLKFPIGQTTALELGAISLTFSILGKILIARKNMESWLLYIINDIICLFMWAQTILITGFALSEVSMIVYYFACLTNDIYAYALWKGMYKKISVNGGFILVKRDLKIKRIIKLRRQFRNLHWDKEVDISKNS